MTPTPDSANLDNASFGDALRHYRDHLRLSQVDVAAAAGLSPRQYIRIERGEAHARIANIAPIAAALGVEPWELVKHASAPCDRCALLGSESQDFVDAVNRGRSAA
jgi:transcriptional regulator with XRE-family HTH domain